MASETETTTREWSNNVPSRFPAWLQILIYIVSLAFSLGYAYQGFATKDWVTSQMKDAADKTSIALDRQAADRKGQLDDIKRSLDRIETRLYEHMEKK